MSPSTPTSISFSYTPPLQNSKLFRRRQKSRSLTTGFNPSILQRIKEKKQDLARPSRKQRTLLRAAERSEKHDEYLTHEEEQDLFEDQKGEVPDYGEDASEFQHHGEADSQYQLESSTTTLAQEDAEIAFEHLYKAQTQAQTQVYNQNLHEPNPLFSSAEEKYFFFARSSEEGDENGDIHERK